MRRRWIRSQLSALEGYSFEPHPGLVKLDQNESPYDVPVKVKTKITDRLRRLAWHRYPPPYADRVAAALGRRLGWSREGIVVATGSNVLVQALLIATCRKGTAMVLDPGFYLYEMEAGLLGNRIIKVPLGPRFSFPTADVFNSLKRHRPDLIFIANPHAPTGTLFPQDALVELLRRAPCLVVIDEAYGEFSGVSLRSELRRTPNLVILRTLSKAFGAAGVRIGYLLARPTLARDIRKVILPFSVSALQVEIAAELIKDSSWVRSNVRAILRERSRLENEMERIGGIEWLPTAANFIAFRDQKRRLTHRAFLKAGIVVRDISRPGLLDGMLRVTVGTPEENNRFLSALRRLSTL